MIDHASAAVTDLEKAKPLYTAMLAPLRYTLMMDLPEYGAAGYGTDDRSDFWMGKVDIATGVHVAFVADSAEMVQAFYDAGIAAGGKDNGAPGYRTIYSAGYYSAFVYDFDGNNIEAVWRDPSK
ncbi:MAG: VOC family protein [Candidatus Paceibacterota bacterium]